MTGTPMPAIVIGMGHAARSFHLPALADLALLGLSSGLVAAVDPLFAGATATDLPSGVTVGAELPRCTDDATVVHVCTPPDSHVQVVEDAVALGYRRFVVEKPMATSAADADRMITLADVGAEIFVVTNWSTSAVTAELSRELQAHQGAQPASVRLAQYKPRIERTTRSSAHRSAYDVEMPHMVALCVAVIGEPLRVVDASSTDLVLDGQRYPGMASARIALHGPGGMPVSLVSDLTAPWRERSVRIEWPDGSRLAAFQPCDSTDRYGQVFTWDADGRVGRRRFLFDDTVRRFLRATYEHFAGIGPRPISDVRFGARITEIISAAKEMGEQGEHDWELLFDDSRFTHR